MNAITGDLGRKYNGNSVTAQLDRKTVPEETSHLQVHIGQSSWINHPQLSRTSWVRSRTFNLMEWGSAAKQSTQTHTHCLFSAIIQETSGQQRQVTCDFVDKSHTFNCQCFSNITKKSDKLQLKNIQCAEQSPPSCRTHSSVSITKSERMELYFLSASF